MGKRGIPLSQPRSQQRVDDDKFWAREDAFHSAYGVEGVVIFATGFKSNGSK